ncbi:MAG TPA: BTAD domain-containing putative transcriptional regulator, partial [Vicinamibacteria bacterium]|nr:BTAD domain-containing putative transcriptional regulator [Vicinamibacteria bacterium]
ATRTLDVLRALAIARGHACALEDLHEWLWPDADGAQAKAACDQALHRLRRLLDAPDAIVQRGAQLRLAQDQVWVDLDAWEAEVARALQVGVAGAEGLMERAFSRFSGPPFQGTTVAPWALAAVERAAGRFLELSVRLGRRHEARGDHESARTVYLRALDFFPTSERCHEALIRGRVAQGDAAAALEHYDRCDRVLRAARGEGASPALAALVAPFRARTSRAG